MNKNIFITGGTSGIGKSLIYKFAKNNYNIFFTYFNNLSEAKSISKDLQKLNVRHNYVKMDLTRMWSINNAFKKFSQQFRKLNIFINNASPPIERKNFLCNRRQSFRHQKVQNSTAQSFYFLINLFQL